MGDDGKRHSFARMSKLVIVVVVLTMAVQCMANIEDIPLTPARCERAHKNTPTADIDQRELCSICDQIVENRYKWPSWNSHYNALTYNFPHHLMPWVNFQACSLSNCSDFVAGSCRVSKTGAATSE